MHRSQEAPLTMQHPFRVLIDARMLIGRFSGISRYVTRLVDQYCKHKKIEVVTLCGQQVPEIWQSRKDIECVTTNFQASDRSAEKRLRWERKHLRKYIHQANVEVYHATWNSGIPSFCPVPSILTIHDLIPWHEPDLYFATSRQYKCYRQAIHSSAKRAARVVTVSHYSREDILSLLRLKKQKVVVVHNGVDFPKDGSVSFDPNTIPYALYVGGHQARKNVETLFKVMQYYWTKFDPSLELRLTGTIQSLTPEARREFHTLTNPERIHFLGCIDDQELSRQYTSAKCLLMMSRNEGFGLPVLEAMAHGCPIIASNTTSLPEVVGEAGILVSPDDFVSAADHLNRLFTHHHIWTDLVQKGSNRAKSFQWSSTADQTQSLYESIISAKKPLRASTTDPVMTKV